jgi:hypothetical protein
VSDWKAVVGKLSEAMQGLNLRMPNIDLVKTSGEEELGAAGYTRRNAIMLSASVISLPVTDPRRAYFLLAHEVFHVLSRADSHRRGCTNGHPSLALTRSTGRRFSCRTDRTMRREQLRLPSAVVRLCQIVPRFRGSTVQGSVPGSRFGSGSRFAVQVNVPALRVPLPPRS